MTSRNGFLTFVPALLLGVGSVQAAESYRCTYSAGGGVFKPALVVFVDGERQLHVGGEAGLTTGVLHNPGRMADWVEARHGIMTEVVQVGGCEAAGRPNMADFSPDNGEGGSDITGEIVLSTSGPEVIPDPEPQPDAPPDLGAIN